MATKRVPGGYADCDLIDRAREQNRQVAEILASIADQVAQDRRLAGPLIRLSLILGQQAQTLMEIQGIRRRFKGASNGSPTIQTEE